MGSVVIWKTAFSRIGNPVDGSRIFSRKQKLLGHVVLQRKQKENVDPEPVRSQVLFIESFPSYIWVGKI